MKEVSKAQRRHLRNLAALAYDRELGAALKVLHSHFVTWQAGEITAQDLNELIHAHHDGISRELYKLYSVGNIQASVARALANDVIRWDEVDDDCRSLLSGLVEYFKEKAKEEN